MDRISALPRNHLNKFFPPKNQSEVVLLVPLGSQLIAGAGKRKEDISRGADVRTTVSKEEMKGWNNIIKKWLNSKNPYMGKVPKKLNKKKSIGFKNDYSPFFENYRQEDKYKAYYSTCPPHRLHLPPKVSIQCSQRQDSQTDTTPAITQTHSVPAEIHLLS